MYDIREALEGIAARELALIITRRQVQKLRGLFGEFSPPLDQVDIKAYARADIKFHQYITQMCRNEMLYNININFNVLLSTYQEGLTRSPDDSLPEHISIIDAMADHDDELSERLMRKHLKLAKKSFELGPQDRL